MSRHNRMRRIEQGVRALPEALPVAHAHVPEVDAGQLAREAARAFADQLARFRRAEAPEAPPDPRERPPDWMEQHIRDKAPEDITFIDIERLERIDPAASTARWEEVKAAAARDLESGWRAGRAVEHWNATAWDRACFLAVRQRLRQTWPPRNDGEALLLDEIAQYETLRQKWVGILTQLTHDPRIVLSLNGAVEPSAAERRTGIAAGALAAVRMIDRLHRLAQSALRTLLGLRRAPAAVIVRQTGQVNLTVGPQLNVSVPESVSSKQ